MTLVHSVQKAVIPTAYEDRAVLALSDADLLGRCEDDIAYLGQGHRPGSAADAIGIARDYGELVRRFKAYRQVKP
jgi:hypothetical protein